MKVEDNFEKRGQINLNAIIVGIIAIALISLIIDYMILCKADPNKLALQIEAIFSFLF